MLLSEARNTDLLAEHFRLREHIRGCSASLGVPETQAELLRRIQTLELQRDECARELARRGYTLAANGWMPNSVIATGSGPEAEFFHAQVKR